MSQFKKYMEMINEINMAELKKSGNEMKQSGSMNVAGKFDRNFDKKRKEEAAKRAQEANKRRREEEQKNAWRKKKK
jgi:hypothetical protein